MKNPFVVNGYEGDRWFCDREKETANLIKYVTNGHNIVLTSPRRVGKTDLVKHMFAQPEIKDNYITINVDLYSTKSFRDFVAEFGRSITEALSTKGKEWINKFLNFLTSIKSQTTFDMNGYPVWSLGFGESVSPNLPLDEIFKFLSSSEKPCIVSIDEFQQITKYKDAWQVEALMRTYIQNCNNANFIFSGSHRHLMTEIFLSPSRPFYNSTIMMSLPLIGKETYAHFCTRLFEEGGKSLNPEVVYEVYDIFGGITAYMQRVMNILYTSTGKGRECKVEDVQYAIDEILSLSNDNYRTLLYQLTERQQALIFAISRYDKAENVTSGQFIRTNGLPSSSSVVSGIKVLLDKDLITYEDKGYSIYDKFFLLWLRRQQMR